MKEKYFPLQIHIMVKVTSNENSRIQGKNFFRVGQFEEHKFGRGT